VTDGPPAVPGIQFLALSVQHTGTHFLGATLRYLTRLSSEGWPLPSVGPEPVGFSMRHLYAHHERGALPWPDTLQEQWMSRWWDSGFPVVVSVRDPGASVETLRRRPQGNYNELDHRAALAALDELLALDRVFGLRVDSEPAERRAQLEGLVRHLRDHGAHFEWPDRERIDRWAVSWPTFNRTSQLGGPSTPD
jgi:hypothetical protein